MHRLCKINELKGFRFFQDFEWDESKCSPFNQINLIYGWNGSGKTTLCDFLKQLELGGELDPNVKFSLLFHDTEADANRTVTHNSIHTIPFVLKVFDQNYIQENIAKIEGLKHIFAVGKDQKDKTNELKHMKKQVEEQSAIIRQTKESKEYASKAFEKAKTEKAKIVRDTVGYTLAYSKNKFYEACCALTDKKLLSNEEYKNALSAIHAEQRGTISIPTYEFIQPSVKDYVCNLLNQTPVNAAIDTLREDAQLSKWVERGLALHEEKNTRRCLFCGNSVPESRFEVLRAHFNKSYIDLANKIDRTINLLQEKIQQFNDAKVGLPDVGVFYPELQKEYSLLQSQARQICDLYTSTLVGVIEVLRKKKSDMVNQGYVDEFISLIELIQFDYDIFTQISVLIERHNAKTANYKQSIEIARKKVEDHLVSESFDEIKELEKIVVDKTRELERLGNQLERATNQVAMLEQEIKNSQIPVDAINRDIEFIMGRGELVFTNSNLGYKITRKGKKAENLSKGEQNAIALIYFFNTLLDVSADPQNTIVVLDDPISSFDSTFYYNAISYIREKTSQAGQVFIFTHKFSLMKDYSKMYRGKGSNRYTIQRVQGGPHILNEDKMLGSYHDEYAYLFKKIYEFVKEPPTDIGEYLPYPNMARRLLEGFLTFKLPRSDLDMIQKVLRLEGDKSTAAGRSILRLLNDQSHLRVIREGDFSDDIDSISILPDILNNLLVFIKCHDERHYNTLALQCDPEYNAFGDPVGREPLLTLREINLFELPSAAGTGATLDESTARKIKTRNAECTFAVQTRGDSMEPKIPKDSIVLVKQCEVIPNAGIGIVGYKGEGYCKKVVQADKGILLVSENKDYKPIAVEDLDEYHVFGEIVGIYEEE